MICVLLQVPGEAGDQLLPNPVARAREHDLDGSPGSRARPGRASSGCSSPRYSKDLTSSRINVAVPAVEAIQSNEVFWRTDRISLNPRLELMDLKCRGARIKQVVWAGLLLASTGALLIAIIQEVKVRH